LARVPRFRSNGRSNPGSTDWGSGPEPRREAAEEDTNVGAPHETSISVNVIFGQE
jgi:hypothetical protein